MSQKSVFKICWICLEVYTNRSVWATCKLGQVTMRDTCVSTTPCLVTAWVSFVDRFLRPTRCGMLRHSTTRFLHRTRSTMARYDSSILCFAVRGYLEEWSSADAKLETVRRKSWTPGKVWLRRTWTNFRKVVSLHWNGNHRCVGQSWTARQKRSWVYHLCVEKHMVTHFWIDQFE